MAISTFFNEVFQIPFIPSSVSLTAKQVRAVNSRVKNFSNLQEAKAAALQAILDTSSESPPSELKRLRILYQRVYTTQELTNFIDSYFQHLNIIK